MDSYAEQRPAGKFTAPWYSREGVVYFISAGSDCESCKSIKIGVSTRKGLLQRLRGIQSANHTRISLLRIIPVITMLEAEKQEKELHEKFSRFARVPHGSLGYEWFHSSPELMEFIKGDTVPLKQQIDGWPNADAILKLYYSLTHP